MHDDEWFLSEDDELWDLLEGNDDLEEEAAYEEQRRQFARVLGHDPDPEIWRYLVKKQYVSEFATGPAGYLRLRREYEQLARLQRGRRKQPPRPGREIPPDPRGEALSRILAAHAARHPAVRQFRERYLAGRLLTHEEAVAWIEDQAARQQGTHIWVKTPVPLDHLPKWGQGSVADQWAWLSAAAAVPDEEKERWGRPSFESHVLQYLKPGSQTSHAVLVVFGSPLHALYRVAETLHREYTWGQAASTIFVLTGIAPRLPLARVTTTRRGGWPALSTITIEARVGVPVRDIAQVYSLARQELLGTGKRDPAVRDEKRAALAVFVAENNDGRTWREVMEAWNREYPKWRYSEVRNFARDARAAYEKITGRRLDWGVREGLRGAEAAQGQP